MGYILEVAAAQGFASYSERKLPIILHFNYRLRTNRVVQYLL